MNNAGLLIASAVLVGQLVLAARSDIRERRVTNQLNVIILLTGIVATLVLRGPAVGALHIAGGVGLAMLVWFPMFALRLMGAGDVKLLAASGAWLGWQGALIATLATGVFGGLLGAAWLVRSQGAVSAAHTVATALRMPWLMKMTPYEPRARVPYAVAIAAGVTTAWVMVNGWLATGVR